MFHMNFNIFCKCVSLWIFFKFCIFQTTPTLSNAWKTSLKFHNVWKASKTLTKPCFKCEKLWSFGMLASQCLAEPCFKTFCVSQMWKTLKFWCVGFKKFSQVMFQNILCVSNVICFGILMCEMNVKVSKSLENKIKIS